MLLHVLFSVLDISLLERLFLLNFTASNSQFPYKEKNVNGVGIDRNTLPSWHWDFLSVSVRYLLCCLSAPSVNCRQSSTNCDLAALCTSANPGLWSFIISPLRSARAEWALSQYAHTQYMVLRLALLFEKFSSNWTMRSTLHSLSLMALSHCWEKRTKKNNTRRSSAAFQNNGLIHGDLDLI